MLAGKLIRVTHFKDAAITTNKVFKYNCNQDKTLKLDEEKSQNVFVKLIVSEQCGNAECNPQAILTKSGSRKVCSGFFIRFVFATAPAT